MKKLTEIDKILFLCVDNTNQNFDKYSETQLNQTLLLKTTIEMVPKLVEALNSAASGRLRAIKMVKYILVTIAGKLTKYLPN